MSDVTQDAAAVEQAVATQPDVINEVVAQAKAGWRTTEFWLHLIALVVGVYLILKEKPEVGALLIGASGFSYNVSRGIAKKGS